MADDAEAKEVLLAQAKALGLKVDKRWSVETLAESVAEAQEAAKEAAAAAFAEAKKTPVKLLRDAWPLADERHNAGEVIDVPVALARHWIEAGVAERADPFPGE